MKNDLTDRQKEILNFIQEFSSFNGYAPTYREIAKQFNIVSTFGVKRHIDALSKKGFLNFETNSSRTLTLTEQVGTNSFSPTNDNLIEVPLIGRVAAGQPIFATENIEETLSFDRSLIGKAEKCFGLKVRGDSMINAGIFEGDVVIVNSQKQAFNGDIVVALLGDESTMKRYSKDGETVRLIPENPKYKDILVKNRDDFSIIGKVIGVFRRYN
ncbi:MAG: transcriptional repressor LexA [bacterium]